MPILHNLLEPEALVRHFQENPPQDFEVLRLESGTPAFTTPFDLLTTATPSLRNGVKKLPMFQRWSPFLRPRSAFIGTTVSEYALLSAAVSPEELVREIGDTLCHDHPFVIIKDLPTDAALVREEDLAVSVAVAEACRGAGFVLMEGQALAYVPIDFSSVDELIARRSPARRKNIRRKLRSRAGMQIDDIALGDPRFFDAPFLASLYAMYLDVYRQSELHFDLLMPSFFRSVLQDAGIDGVVFTYRVGGVLIGYNLCVGADERLIDKYVGFVYPAAREHNLYAVSWFHNLEYARARGLRCYVAGWTDREVKRELGASFTFTRHAVYVRNPIVRGVLRTLKRSFESDHD
ncbi:MAG: GNAT family N-acetyltransferase [Acidobacteriota bacterium]